jgi:hypothetical protein
MAFRVDLVRAVDEEPLLVGEDDRLAEDVARPVDEVRLDEVADLRPERRPRFVVGDRDE